MLSLKLFRASVSEATKRELNRCGLARYAFKLAHSPQKKGHREVTRKSPNLPISRQVKKPTNSLVRPFCLCPHTTARHLVPRGSRVIVTMPRPPHSLGGLRAGDGRSRWKRRRPRRVQGGARTHRGRGRRLRREEGRRRPPPPPTPHPPLSERAVNDPFTSRPWFTSRPVTSRPGSRRDPLTSTRFTVRPVHVGSRCDPLHFDDSKDKKICLAILMFRRYSEEEF
jgi:hypothetical protein